MNRKQIRQALFLNNPASDVVEAFDRVLGDVSPNECPVLDVSGKPLEVGKIYQYGDKIIKVRRWEFGSGNMLDRYYRLYYTDSNLKDTFLVVEARYPNGVFNGAVYRSQLVRQN